MSKLIVVVGITGTQGSSVAETFLALPDWKVRGITRNPSSKGAEAIAAKGAEVVKGDLDDKASLKAAFIGATAIFGVTDFWQHFGNPDNHQKAADAGKSPNEYACDLEIAQGLNIAEAAADAEVLKTLERFVFSSLSEVRKWSKGKYVNVWHFDGKAEIVNTINAKVPELAKRMSCVQIGHYVTNWKQFPMLLPQKQEDGSFLLAIPEEQECEIPFVVTARDTGAFVKALVELPPGKQLLGVSQFMSWPDFTKLWGEILGVKASSREVPMEEFWKDTPEVLKKEVAESYAYNAEFGWTGGDPDVMKPEEAGVDIPQTMMEEYIRSEDWSSVL